MSGKTYDRQAAAEARRKEMKEITGELEAGVEHLFSDGEFKRYLTVMARFPNYSVNNVLLIRLQKPDATLVQSFSGWKKIGRFVKRGEKGIRILAPAPFTYKRTRKKREADGRLIYGPDGAPVMEEVPVRVMNYKPVSTFDVTQTEGKPLPQIGVSELSGTADGYGTLFRAAVKITPVPVSFEDIRDPGKKGFYSKTENRIVIRSGMGELQNLKTLVHEMAHQRLHSTGAPEENVSTDEAEIEAESVAYTVLTHYGFDTSDYSFAYVASYAYGHDAKEKQHLLSVIQKTASELIAKLDTQMSAAMKEDMAAPDGSRLVFYAAECSEFHNYGEFADNLSLPDAADAYRRIVSGPAGGGKTLGFRVVSKDGTFEGEYDLVLGGKLQIDLMKEILPNFAERADVQRAIRDIRTLLPELA